MGKDKRVDPQWICVYDLLRQIVDETEFALEFTHLDLREAQEHLQTVRKLAEKAQLEMLAVAQKAGRNVTANSADSVPAGEEARSC